MSPRVGVRLPRMDATNLAELYDLPVIDWGWVAERLGDGVTQGPGTGGPDRHTWWLATIDADGSPHVTALGALWVDGDVWFTTSERSRKGRNLARDARCTASLSTTDVDLSVTGEAERVTDPAAVAGMAARWAADGWPCTVDGSGTAITAPYSAPSAGPGPWQVYRLTPRRAHALRATEPGGATRWSFDA